MKIDWLLFCLLWGNFVVDQNNTIISSYYPQYAKDNYDIGETLIGFIFAAHPIGVFISSLILAKIMHKKGMKKLNCILGMFMQAFASGLFIIVKYYDNKTFFIAISFTGRILLGIGQGLFVTPCFSYLPVLYKDNLEEVVGYIEAVAGIGLSMGPVIGGVLNEYLGYESTFLFNIFISLIIIPLEFKYIPYSLKKQKHSQIIDKIEEIDQLDDQKQNKGQLVQGKQQTILEDDDENRISKIKDDRKQRKQNQAIQADNSEIYMQSEIEQALNASKIQKTQLLQQNEQSKSSSNIQDDEVNDSKIEENLSSSQQGLDISKQKNLVKQHQKQAGDENNEGNDDDDEEESVCEFEINYIELLSHRDIVFSCWIVFIPACLMGFLDPCLGPFAESEYGLNSTMVGTVFFAGAGLYILMLPIAALMSKKIKGYKKFLFFGLLTSSVSMYLMAPSFGLPRSKWWMFIAQAVMNIGNAFVYIPVIPDQIKLLEGIYPHEEEDTIGDISSALWNSSFALGYFIGPSLGGVLADTIGFEKTCFYFASVFVGISVLYLIFGKVLTERSNQVADDEKQSLLDPEKLRLKKKREQASSFMSAGRSINFSLHQKKVNQFDFKNSRLGQLEDNDFFKSVQEEHIGLSKRDYKYGSLIRLKQSLSQSTTKKLLMQSRTNSIFSKDGLSPKMNKRYEYQLSQQSGDSGKPISGSVKKSNRTNSQQAFDNQKKQ